MWSSAIGATWRRLPPGWLSSRSRAPAGQSLHLFLGRPLRPRRRPRSSAGAPPRRLRVSARLRVLKLSWLLCNRQQWGIRRGAEGPATCPHPPPRAPTLPGGILSVVPESVCVAGSIQQCAATCCRPRRAHGRSCSRPRIGSGPGTLWVRAHSCGLPLPTLFPPNCVHHHQQRRQGRGVSPFGPPKCLERVNASPS